MNRDLGLLEKRIGYSFGNRDYLLLALRHSSFANESKEDDESNERLEFLGDSVLSLIVSEYMYLNYPGLPEGEMSRIRASVVCRASLSSLSRRLTLGEFLLLGKGENESDGRDKDSILENAFEALVAAVYLDGGLTAARGFVLGQIVPVIKSHADPEMDADYKSLLQQRIQKDHTGFIKYKTVGESGPAHKRVFEVEVWLDSNLLGRGTGSTKKEAEKNAARSALEYFPE